MKVGVFQIVILSIILIMVSASFAADSKNKAGNFTLEGIDGEKVALSDLLSDKKVVLVFWTSWCPHCLAEIPHID